MLFRSFCSDLTTIQNVNLTGNVGGTYSSSLGLNINPTNGDIIPNSSTAGDYNVTYTIAASNGCPSISSMTNISITTLPNATISYSGPFCSSLISGQNVNLQGNIGGNFWTSQTGLSLDATDGTITPSTSNSGNYTITYTIDAAGGCPTVNATANVIITTLPVATISYNGPFCSSLANAQTVTLTGNSGGLFTSDISGLNFDSSTGAITPGLSTAGNYVVTYLIDAANGCPTVSASSPITITQLPEAAISYVGSPYCTNNTTPQNVIFTGTTGGSYTSTTGINLNGISGAINPSLSAEGNYTINYLIPAAGGCADVNATATVTIVKSIFPITDFSYVSPVCSNGTNPIPVPITNFTTGGIYSSTTGLNVDANNGTINLTNSTPGTYSVTYAIAASGCVIAKSDTSIITINPTITPVTEFSYLIPSCVDETTPNPITLNGFTQGGTFSSQPEGLILNASNGGITLLTSNQGTYTVTYSVASEGCSLAGNNTEEVIINREGCLNIPTAFSPNNDGVNDKWEIEHINLYAEVTIEIFNRWGQLIFEYSGTGDSYADLENQWDGKYEGKDLPINSFIYIVNLHDDKKPIQGIVTIIK